LNRGKFTNNFCWQVIFSIKNLNKNKTFCNSKNQCNTTQTHLLIICDGHNDSFELEIQIHQIKQIDAKEEWIVHNSDDTKCEFHHSERECGFGYDEIRRQQYFQRSLEIAKPNQTKPNQTKSKSVISTLTTKNLI
jgi:hypothetical protein